MSLEGGAWVAVGAMYCSRVQCVAMTTPAVASTQALLHTDHILTIGKGWVGSRKTLAKALALIGNNMQT